MDIETSTISRRELLKRGALVGGAVMWVAPIVQVVGMGRAYAKETSPDCSRFCLKWEVDGNSETRLSTCTDEGTIRAIPVWTNQWNELGNGRRTRSEDDSDGEDRNGTILTCPRDGVNDASAATRLTSRDGREFIVYGAKNRGFWVAFPNDIMPAPLEDEDTPWSAAVKCGQGKVTFKASDLSLGTDPCFRDPEGEPYQRILIPACNNGKDISHIELIIDWCPGGLPS